MVSLTFYAVSLTKRYITLADNTAHQARMSATHGVDAVGFSKKIMEIYDSLTEEERQLNGT